MHKLSGYFHLMRPINCLMMGIAVIVGAILADVNAIGTSRQNLVYGFITGFALTAASMAINDYYDREIDAVNEPDRPIPSGLIYPREALAFAFLHTLVGLATAYLTSMFCFVVAIIAWALFVIYTTVGKRTGLPGNLLVSLCVTIPFIYGSYTVTNATEVNVLIFASMAFLSNTGREITKGIVDVRGDRIESVKTLAVRYGAKSAAVVATMFYVLAVVLSPLPWLLNLISVWYLPLVAITDVGLIVSSITLLKDHSRKNARAVKKIVLVFFLMGLFAFLAGSSG